MRNIEDVAEGLTPALERELLTLSEHPQDKSVSWSVKFGYRLERMGLAKRTLLTDRTLLTPLGRLVCHHLRQRSEAA